MSKTLTTTVTVDADELREWAAKHADAGHHGVAHALFKAAEGIESVPEQHERELREQIARDIEAMIPGAEERIENWTTRNRPDKVTKFRVVIETAKHAASIARGEQP